MHGAVPALVLAWLWLRRIMGWDNAASFGYLFHSGSGDNLLLALWGTALFLWRTSCSDRRWCVRRARHEITDPESGVTHKICWKHAHLPAPYGAGRIKAIQAKHALLYLGEHPGRDKPPPPGLSSPRRHVRTSPEGAYARCSPARSRP